MLLAQIQSNLFQSISDKWSKHKWNTRSEGISRPYYHNGTNMMAETRALKDGFKLCYDKGIQMNNIESDSKVMVDDTRLELSKRP